jgi:hypothetical protein
LADGRSSGKPVMRPNHVIIPGCAAAGAGQSGRSRMATCYQARAVPAGVLVENTACASVRNTTYGRDYVAVALLGVPKTTIGMVGKESSFARGGIRSWLFLTTWVRGLARVTPLIARTDQKGTALATAAGQPPKNKIETSLTTIFSPSVEKLTVSLNGQKFLVGYLVRLPCVFVVGGASTTPFQHRSSPTRVAASSSPCRPTPDLAAMLSI